MALRTLEGQATELGWRRDGVEELQPEDYLDLIMHKTCWYTTVHPSAGRRADRLGGSADLRPMAQFGFFLGAAFQIQDDLLNLRGHRARVRQGDQRRPLRGQADAADDPPGAQRPRRRSPDGRPLSADSSARSAPRRSSSEVRGLLDDYGSIAFAAAYAKGIAGAALEAFETAFATAEPGPDRDFIRAVVPYMVDRRS